MATFAFWNVARRTRPDLVSTLCIEHDVDVLILSEDNIKPARLLFAINQKSRSTYVSPFNPSTKLTFATRYPLNGFKLISDDNGVAIRLVRPPIGQSILLTAVHLPSKLHRTAAEQTLFCVRVAAAVKDAERKTGLTNSLVIGDFNMNPFEDGITAADGLHSVMDKALAKKGQRIVDGVPRDFFYNPMWSRLGDESDGPPGTYFRSGGQISLFWHTFDQVLIRPSLLKYYSPSSLRVLTKIGNVDLTPNDKIDGTISDHLPIIFSLDTEKGIAYD